jgi:hypothetical protein
MLAKPGPLPSGPGWSYEVKWDGFRITGSFSVMASPVLGDSGYRAEG